MRSIFGYVLAGLGIIGTALSSIKELRGLLTFLPETLVTNGSFLIVSLALVGVGVIIAISDRSDSRNKKGEEVPIYDEKGKKIVGYRRLK